MAPTPESTEKGPTPTATYLHDHEKASDPDQHTFDIDRHERSPTRSRWLSRKFVKLNAKLDSLAGFESRGIARVLPSERHAPSRWDDVSVALLWFSANISVNNIAVGLFGPLIFSLGFLDCAMCAVFGALLGSLTTAYMSIWGPMSGNRTMVVLRYFFGYWPAKLPTILNIILMVGYATIDAIIGGQMLSAVNGNGLSIAVGVIVIQLVALVVTVFGMKPFQTYERYAWVPQLVVLSILIGVAAPSFETTSQSTGSKMTVAANRLSFLSLCLYIPNSWGAAASDFYVYYPERTSRLKIFLLTLSGLWLSFCLTFMIGIGIGSGIATNDAWAEAYGVSAGAVFVAALDPIKGFGHFCAVIIALGLIANSVPGTYAAALDCQVLGRYAKAVPRWIWSGTLIVIELVLALAGREHLLVIMQNFLALMGYGSELMVAIVLLEHVFFRRSGSFDWDKWEDRSYLPIGLAALVAFLIGWMGAILGMYQAWYTGPLAALAGSADVGLWIGTAFTLVAYPGLRWLEIRYFGR